jgi:hypothetical protein
MRPVISRTRKPLMIGLSPQEMSDEVVATNAISVIAPRGVVGIPASHRIARRTNGVEATTYPPTIIITICMVKGTRVQKFLPASMPS